jgi:hypothetical protein
MGLPIMGESRALFTPPPMTDTDVVSPLKEKRIQVASQIESLQAQLRQSVIDLDHVEAALKLFDPEVDLSALPARKIAPVSYDTKGDIGRVILETLRTARGRFPRPRSARHWQKKRGIVRSMPGVGQQLLWEAAG